MIKRIIVLFITILLAACHASQPVARTTRPYNSKGKITKNSKTPAPRVTGTKSGRGSKTPSNSDIRKIEQTYESAKEETKSNSNTTVYSKDEILEATTRVKVTTAMVVNYISTYRETAQNNMAQYGIPASIILGQGILESGAGTGPLSVLANNHFGIKCHKEWEGKPSVLYDDDTEQECFRKYSESAESYQDHSLFLTSRPRYAFLFDLEKGDYVSWANGLKAAGYATDPKYPDKLIGIIERYNLKQYDTQVIGIEFIPDVKEKPAITDRNLYQVGQGDTLYSISKRFNISIDDLKRKNNIQDNAISIGQSLKVQ